MSNSPSSTGWRKPSDVMKFRQMKSKKRILERRFGLSDDTSSSKASNCAAGTKSADDKTEEFSNPFKCPSRKRPRTKEFPLLEELGDVSADQTLFMLLNQSNVGSSPNDVCSSSGLALPTIDQEVYKTVAGENKVNLEPEWLDYLPVDWSLKTALRLTSSHPFPWNGRMTSLEESSGVTGFVRCLSLGADDDSDYGECALDTSPNAQLFQCCQTWCHPSLPWLSLFPRNLSRRLTTAASSTLDPQMYSALLSDWADSFRSLFHLVRARQCPYFYLCAHSFTVLFRASGISGCPHLNALLTPTTKGLRTALTEEGIEFTMPLENESVASKASNSQSDKSSQDSESGTGAKTTDNDGDARLDDDNDEQKEEVVTWLKSVGVEGDMLANIDRDVGLKTGKSVDYTQQSVVYVEDGNVQALFNYLLNSSNCVARIGPLVGIPPTLLSPVAFTGGTLRSLKTRQCQALQEGQLKHVLDVNGPVLPHVAQYVKELLSKRAPDGQFSVAFTTLEASTSFSQCAATSSNSGVANAPAAFVQQSLSDCGLLPQVLREMCHSRPSQVVREVQIKNCQYLWS